MYRLSKRSVPGAGSKSLNFIDLFCRKIANMVPRIMQTDQNLTTNLRTHSSYGGVIDRYPWYNGALYKTVGQSKVHSITE